MPKRSVAPGVVVALCLMVCAVLIGAGAPGCKGTAGQADVPRRDRAENERLLEAALGKVGPSVATVEASADLDSLSDGDMKRFNELKQLPALESLRTVLAESNHWERVTATVAPFGGSDCTLETVTSDLGKEDSSYDGEVADPSGGTTPVKWHVYGPIEVAADDSGLVRAVCAVKSRW